MTEFPSLRRLNVSYTLVHVVYWAMFAIFAGYQTSLLLGRGFTSGEAGIFASIRCFAGILAQPLLGGWADRHPEVPIKRLLNACLVLALGVNVVFYTTRPGFWGTALIFLTLGILELNAYPLLDSMAVQFIAAGVDMSYSLSRGLGSLSYALACVACGQQAVRFGTESLLLTHMALLVLMIAVVALYPAFPKDALQAQGGGERPHSILYILKSSRPFTLTLVSLFFTLAAIMPIVSFMVNLVSDRGGDEGHLGLALFLMGASELPAALLFTPLFRRFGAAGTLRMSICFMAVKPLLFLLAPGLSGLLLVQPVQLLGYGLFTPASVYYANANVFPVDQVKGQSIMMIASNGLGAMFGNFLAGYAIDWGGADAIDQDKNYTPMNDHKANFAWWSLVTDVLHDSLTLCNWVWPMTMSPTKARNYRGDLDLEAKFFKAVTGEDLTTDDLYQAGAKIMTLQRANTVRGMTKADGTLGNNDLRADHDVITAWAFDKDPDKQPFTEGTDKMDRDDFQTALGMVYGKFGWDEKLGCPTAACLDEYGMADVKEELQSLNLLP